MATQRRKRTPKKAAPKRTIWRTLFWLGFKLSLVGAAFMVVFGIYLDTKVRERFDGEKWQFPVMVYSRPLELYPSQRLSQAQMLRELNMLSYKQVVSPTPRGSTRSTAIASSWYAVHSSSMTAPTAPVACVSPSTVRGWRGSSLWRTSVS